MCLEKLLGGVVGVLGPLLRRFTRHAPVLICFNVLCGHEVVTDFMQ